MKRPFIDPMLRGWAGLVLALGVFLQACADRGVDSPGSEIQRERTALNRTLMKMNGSGISVQYRIEATPRAGRAAPVVLSFSGVTDPVSARAQLSVDAGLSLGAAVSSLGLPVGEITTWSVNVVPASDGTTHLHVVTTQHGASSATSIAVQVGRTPPTLPSSSELKLTPGGEKILSMPVR